MASLDMSDAFDPDTMDEAVCVRSGPQTINESGIASQATSNTTFYGAFISEGRWIQRGADWERVSGSMLCVTPFLLNDGSKGQTADVVVFAGRSYTVSNVNDFSNYGPGFVDATLDLLPLSGGPSTNL